MVPLRIVKKKSIDYQFLKFSKVMIGSYQTKCAISGKLLKEDEIFDIKHIG